MKIASYNIMSGGFAEYSQASTMPERLDDIRAVVQEIDADVIGFIDTFRWDTTFSTQELKNLFNYPHILRTNLEDARLNAGGGESIGLVLMSKQPWKEGLVVRLDTRNGLKVTYEMNGKEVELFLAYLDDLHEDVRLAQIKALLTHAHSLENTVIMGDLNTFAPSDLPAIAIDSKSFYAANPGVEAKFGPTVTEMQRCEVAKLLESRGFKDAGVDAGPTMPTKLFPMVTTKPFLRVDHCFAGGTLTINDFQVHTSKKTAVTSDHLPITFRVE